MQLLHLMGGGVDGRGQWRPDEIQPPFPEPVEDLQASSRTRETTDGQPKKERHTTEPHTPGVQEVLSVDQKFGEGQRGCQGGMMQGPSQEDRIRIESQASGVALRGEQRPEGP